jgi:PRTRC genetic system ThiF family protein
MKTVKIPLPILTNFVDIGRIFVIGAGGTGSYVVPHIARLLSSTNSNARLTIVDGDIVEEKNLVRQNFCSADVGRYKSQVLAERYSAALGIAVEFLTKHLTKDCDTPSYNALYITCTDNLASRAIVCNSITDRCSESFWIDCGNEKENGQVVICGGSARRDNFRLLPTPFDIFPEYAQALKEEKEAEESCAEHAAASPVQAGFINNLAASIAVNYVDTLISHRVLSSHMTKFSISNVFHTVPITQDVFSLRSNKKV